MSARLLACAVFPGMFSDELAVRYPPTTEGATSVASLFVPKDSVVNNGGQFVRVKVFKEGETTWAVLPDDTQTVIEIDADDLK